MTRPVGLAARGWGLRHPGRREWALRGVDLDVGPGERVLLLGPSGAGKSTLLAALAGLLDPDAGGDHEGELTVDGGDPRAVRDRTGLLLQDPESQLVMARAGDDVAFGLENRAVPAERIWARVDEVLAMVGFPYGRQRRTDALSGGEQQRLALAGVLAHGPGLVLLDEPTANLDPVGAALVRSGIAAVQRDGATTVLVEHRVTEALPLVDRVVVLVAGGGVVADGPPTEVFGARAADLEAAGVWTPGGPPERRPRTGSPGPDVLVAERVGFRHHRGGPWALRGVSTELRAGEVLAVTGPNGSGKSTLAGVLAGLEAPTAGRVRAARALAADDADVAPHRWPAARLVHRIGTVFQDPEHQFLTGRVRTELALGPRAAGLPSAEVDRLVVGLLDRMRLTHLAEANPFTLSGGEKRRLSVATALADSPPVLVLDEPTFGQDRATWGALVDLLAAHRDAGGTVCAATHDSDLVAALADRVLTLDRGRAA